MQPKRKKSVKKESLAAKKARNSRALCPECKECELQEATRKFSRAPAVERAWECNLCEQEWSVGSSKKRFFCPNSECDMDVCRTCQASLCKQQERILKPKEDDSVGHSLSFDKMFLEGGCGDHAAGQHDAKPNKQDDSAIIDDSHPSADTEFGALGYISLPWEGKLRKVCRAAIAREMLRTFCGKSNDLDLTEAETHRLSLHQRLAYVWTKTGLAWNAVSSSFWRVFMNAEACQWLAEQKYSGEDLKSYTMQLQSEMGLRLIERRQLAIAVTHELFPTEIGPINMEKQSPEFSG
ncbi:hypothetical protein DIPPA_55468 [Diplonema papillatum]|nr:hypothetical protein DIPPA_55468 [Diplonema papillatum]